MEKMKRGRESLLFPSPSSSPAPSSQHVFETLDYPFRRFAVPFLWDRAFLPLPGPAINRVSAGGSLVGSVPINSLVPMALVSGRSVLSRRVRPSKNRRFFPRSIVSLPPPYR